MGQLGSSNATYVPLGEADNERGYACMRAGIMWGTLVLSSKFCYKPKTVPPKGSLKKWGG